MNKYEDLNRIKVLRDEGVLTEAEYEEQKRIILSSSYNPNTAVAANDAPNMGFAILGFFIPMAGLILYLVWKDQYPKKSKSAGKGALIGVITWVALYIIAIVIYVVFLVAIIGMNAH